VLRVSSHCLVTVKQVIAAWTGDTSQSDEYRKLYYAELDRVKVSYSGSPTVTGPLPTGGPGRLRFAN